MNIRKLKLERLLYKVKVSLCYLDHIHDSEKYCHRFKLHNRIMNELKRMKG